MSVDELIKHFKTQTRAAKKLGYTQSAISNWKARGRVPNGAQLKAHFVTRGRLKADKSILV